MNNTGTFCDVNVDIENVKAIINIKDQFYLRLEFVGGYYGC